MTRRLVTHFAAAFCLCAAAAAHAHHSHPYFYDQCRSITIEGRIDSVRWIDPHTLIVLTMDDGTAYTIDWNALRSMTNSSTLAPAQAALVPGARIAVAGNPIRSSAGIRQFFPDYTREVNPNTIDPTLIRRLDDSWRWTRGSGNRMPAFGPTSDPPLDPRAYACAE